MPRGSKPRQFGVYEAKQALGWRGLAWAIATAGVTWGLAELVPWMESSEGWIAGGAGAVTLALRILQQWLTDNRGYFDP